MRMYSKSRYHGSNPGQPTYGGSISKAPYGGYNYRPSLELVLIDEEGNKIEATIKPKLIWRSANHVKEFASIIMSNFDLTKNTESFKFSLHPSKIVVTEDTVIKSFDGLGIPKHGLHFQEFPTILSSGLPSECSLDVIGELIEYSEIITTVKENNAKTSRMVIQLEDLSKNVISCTLWDDYVVEMDEYIKSFKGGGVIVILQFAKLSVYQGTIGVSNYWWGSRLILDQDHPDIIRFKEICFPDGECESRTITHVTSHSYTSDSQKFLQTSEFTNLLQVASMREDVSCVFLATIVAFEKPEKWWYKACLKCKKQVETDGVRFYCVLCDKAVEFPVQRFSLQITVKDDTGSAALMMFDHDVRAIVHTSVKDLLEKRPKNSDLDAFPAELNVLMNKTFLFRIGVSRRFVSMGGKTHTIWNMTDDESLIAQFKSATLSLQDTQSDAASSDKLPLSITPHKRDYVEVDSGDDKDDCQMSTNKHKLKVKVEKVD